MSALGFRCSGLANTCPAGVFHHQLKLSCVDFQIACVIPKKDKEASFFLIIGKQFYKRTFPHISQIGKLINVNLNHWSYFTPIFQTEECGEFTILLNFTSYF